MSDSEDFIDDSVFGFESDDDNKESEAGDNFVAQELEICELQTRRLREHLNELEQLLDDQLTATKTELETTPSQESLKLETPLVVNGTWTHFFHDQLIFGMDLQSFSSSHIKDIRMHLHCVGSDYSLAYSTRLYGPMDTVDETTNEHIPSRGRGFFVCAIEADDLQLEKDELYFRGVLQFKCPSKPVQIECEYKVISKDLYSTGMNPYVNPGRIKQENIFSIKQSLKLEKIYVTISKANQIYNMNDFERLINENTGFVNVFPNHCIFHDDDNCFKAILEFEKSDRHDEHYGFYLALFTRSDSEFLSMSRYLIDRLSRAIPNSVVKFHHQ